MNLKCTPRIKILSKDNGVLSLIIDSNSPSNIAGSSCVHNIPCPANTTEICLTTKGFDYFDTHDSTSKLITGSILIKQVINAEIIETTVSHPVYVVKNTELNNGEQKAALALKKAINFEWSRVFGVALEESLHPKQNPSRDLPIAKKSLFNRLALKPTKKMIYLTMAFGVILSINAILIHMYSKKNQQPQNNLLSAEQMAVQQDEILNNAFKEIGIDRSKLASDMSCFTE